MDIKKFDINILNNKSNKICIISKSNGGKTTLIHNIISKLNNKINGVIIAPTDRLDKLYKKFIPNSYIEEQYDCKILKNVLSIQKKNKGKQNIIPLLFIMDDVGASKIKWLQDKNFDNLMKKDYNINFIIGLQHSIIYSQCEYIDYLFIFELDLLMNRKKIYEIYFINIFSSFEIFDSMYMNIAKNYICLVLDNKNKILYYYKADLINEPIYNINIFDIIKYNKQFIITI
jgi:hypothetical protein